MNAARKALQKLYEDNRNRAQPICQLMEAFKWLSKSFSSIYIVIDGLDESSVPSELCQTLSQCLTMKNVNVLATSRPETEIEASFNKVSNLKRLEVEDDFVDADIQIYIDWRLTCDQKLNRIKPQLKQDIKEKLYSKSRGM